MSKFSFVVWLVIGLLVGAASKATADVRDHAQLFSKKAIADANDQINLIKTKRKKDLVIETFQTVPDGKRDEVAKMDSRAKAKFYDQWAAERAKQLELDGIYVLITKAPTFIYVATGPETRKKAFTAANARELTDRMVARFKASEFDRGLLEGVSFTRETVKGNVKEAANPDQRAAGGVDLKGILCTAIVALAVVWIIIALIRGVGRTGAAGAGTAMGGGGFMSGLLGGLFGAVAGNWLYHSMFGGHSAGWGGSAAHGDEPPTDSGASDEGRDFTGAGGDYGDYGADTGGDWGGGGGDWGGGGDF